MLTRSEIVWAFWLLLFLAFELTAKDVLGWAPWYSLSRTAWMDEKAYPILKTILLGFLIGLGVHIRYQTGLLKSTLCGVLIALGVELLIGK